MSKVAIACIVSPFANEFTARRLDVVILDETVLSKSLEIIEGDLPNCSQKLVLEWATFYQRDFCKCGRVRTFINYLF
jgi:hypothetical protein